MADQVPEGSTQATSANAILEVDQVTKKFGAYTAVDKVSLKLREGKTYGLIGPNGAGKTTLLNLITGALSPTAGSIFFNETDVAQWKPHQRVRAGIVRKYQITNLYESRTVIENMRLAFRSENPDPLDLLREHDNSDIDPDIETLLSVADLEPMKHNKASDLSHGQKQWLEILMTVATEPDLLLLDEPTSGLSSGEKKESISLIRELQDRHPDMAVLVIEHDVEFIKNLSDKLFVLHEGRIIAEGSGKEIENDEQVQSVYLKRNR